MKYLIIMSLMLVAGCGSESGSSSAGKNPVAPGSVSIAGVTTLTATLAVNESQTVTARKLVTVPTKLDRIQGAGVKARAVLNLGLTQCYYEAEIGQGTASFKDCTGGKVPTDQVQVEVGEVLELHLEYGDSMLMVELQTVTN